MNLNSGIKAYAAFDLSERIEVSHGTTNNFLTYKELYAENAFIPKFTWRPINDVEKDILITNEYNLNIYSNYISIVQLPTSLSSDVLTYFDKNHPIKKGLNFLEEDDLLLATANVIEYIEDNFLIREDQFEIQGYSFQDAFHLPTSTIDTETKMCMGLHLDDWSSETLDKRKTAANRICINFGKEPRYLIFINLSISQIFDLCNFTDSEEIDLIKKHPGSLGRYFFEKNPDYPAFRIKLDPGEAYIAPTENVFHDGSTFGNSSTDINLTITGYFKPLLTKVEKTR